MTSSSPDESGNDQDTISLVRDDAAFRFQRAIGLIPKTGLGIARRAIVFALLTWAPIAIWAFVQQSRLAVTPQEPLLAHFGIHIRFLVALPLLIIAEGVANMILPRVIPYFLSSGILPPSEVGRFREVLQSILRLRNKTLPWVLILGAILALLLSSPALAAAHELAWAWDPDPQHLGFGGLWFLYFARPIFMALMLGWLWRLILFGLMLRRISKLNLSLVPSHPDGNGGLGFLEMLPAMFSPIVFGLSALMASHWSHQIVYHQETLAALRLPMAAFAILVLILFLGPFFVFAGPLRKAKRAAELQYGALVGRHGRMVRQKWIEGIDVKDDAGLLGAPEMGPVADHISMYQMVEKMRALPVGKRALMSIVVPVAIPFLVVVSLQIPIKEVLLGLLKAIA